MDATAEDVEAWPRVLHEASIGGVRPDPATYRVNVLAPIAFDAPKFDSVGLNYLLHCLPGAMRSKGVVLQHLRALTNPGGVVVGATLLHDRVRRNWLARQVMARNNAHGIFSNADDDLDGLRSVLAQHLARADGRGGRMRCRLLWLRLIRAGC